MKVHAMSTVAAVLAASFLLASCGPPAATPVATQAPAAPTKAAAPTTAPAAPTAAAPTKAPAAQPTAVPKVAFPEKGKSITLIVPWPAGGPVDVNLRLVFAAFEKAIGAPIQIVNRGGASGQIGATELIQSKPDGYTLGQIQLPTTVATYLDPATQAVYARKDFQTVAQYAFDGVSFGVKADRPYKDLKDLVNGAKAKPAEVKIGTAGLGGVTHFPILKLEKLAGIDISEVHFAGGNPAITATLGGHVDGVSTGASALIGYHKSGEIRILGTFTQEQNKFIPDVKPAKDQGYDIVLGSSSGIAVPAGTPKAIVDVLSAAVKKAVDDPEVQKRALEIGFSISYLDPAQYGALWDQNEKDTKDLLPLVTR